MKIKNMVSFLLLLSLYAGFFSSSYTTVEAADIEGLQTVNINSEEITLQATPNPTKVWYSAPFKVGNLPPARMYVEQKIYAKIYRGWLTRTNITDTKGFVVYEGYIYRPDLGLPIPSRTHPVLQ